MYAWKEFLQGRFLQFSTSCVITAHLRTASRRGRLKISKRFPWKLYNCFNDLHLKIIKNKEKKTLSRYF